MYNKIIVIGNLGRDPEMRYTPSGQSVTSFSVATNRRYRTAAGEQRDETEWFNVDVWGRIGEACNQFLPGAAKFTSKGGSAAVPTKTETARRGSPST